MDKEEALIEFLKGLRIVLNNASAYSKDHPYFLNSASTFKQKIDPVFSFFNPIKIEFTVDSLAIGGKPYEKSRLYVELAAMFHFRKIKSVTFSPDLTIEELIDFLSSVSLPIKEILNQGGIAAILRKAQSRHIIAEELDYSHFLREGTDRSKEACKALFKEALEKADPEKIKELADNFAQIIAKFRIEDFLQDNELREGVYNFLLYLKDNQKDRFDNSTKELFRWVLKDKGGPIPEEGIKEIKVFFKDLGQDALLEVLSEQIANNDNFNSLSFKVFLRLFDQDAHKQIAPALEARLNTDTFKNNPKVRRKIKDLFSSSDDYFVLPLYRNALGWLAEGGGKEEGLVFDRNLARINYRFILLNLLAGEKDRKKLALISERILKACNQIAQEKDLAFFKTIWEALDKKSAEDKSLEELFEQIKKYISGFIESALFTQDNPKELAYLTDKIKRSALGFDFYQDKIFNENKINPYALKLLVRLFTERLDVFYANLERRRMDFDFTITVIKSLKYVDEPTQLGILEKIFSFSNNIVKIEILKSMQAFVKIDGPFLTGALEKEEAPVKKEAFAILAREGELRKQALGKLFSVSGIFGSKNNILIENISVVEDDQSIETESYLLGLSGKRFFWNRNVRERAKEVLKNRNVR